MNGLRFSLVMGSVGRAAELKRFLVSLERQDYADCELLVVDQNEDERLAPLLADWSERLTLRRLRSERGLSRARNAGLAQATGDVVAFPDDDCWYPDGLLARVASLLAEHAEWDGLTGRALDERGRPILSSFAASPGLLSRRRIWRQAVSISIFLRRDLTLRVGPFDEELGAGTETGWASGEETDYLLRALDSGARLRYDPAIVLGHPAPPESADDAACAHSFGYGLGMARVLRKHHFPAWFSAYQTSRALGGAAFSLLRGKPGRASLHWAAFRGRLSGLLRAGASPGRTSKG